MITNLLFAFSVMAAAGPQPAAGWVPAYRMGDCAPGTGQLRDLAVSADGQKLVYRRQDDPPPGKRLTREVVYVDVRTGEVLARLAVKDLLNTPLAVSADGTTVVFLDSCADCREGAYINRSRKYLTY